MNGLEIVQERPSSTLAAVPLAGGNAIALVSHASIVILDSQLQELQQLDLPHPLHPAAHPPHVSSTDSHLVVHVPVSAGGARSRTTPLVYSFDGGQLFPLDLDAFDMAPAPERKAGKRTAVFCDSLAAVPLARPIASKVAQEAKDDNDEDALYGGGDEAKPAAAAPSDGIVQPQDLGAERWEWIAEIDSKGDMKVRSGACILR